MFGPAKSIFCSYKLLKIHCEKSFIFYKLLDSNNNISYKNYRYINGKIEIINYTPDEIYGKFYDYGFEIPDWLVEDLKMFGVLDNDGDYIEIKDRRKVEIG